MPTAARAALDEPNDTALAGSRKPPCHWDQGFDSRTATLTRTVASITFPVVAPRYGIGRSNEGAASPAGRGTDMRTFLSEHFRSLLIMHTAIVCGLLASLLAMM